MKPRTHPDSHDLHDWPLHGPRDPEIADLVDRLAYDHALRLCEIEGIIRDALSERLALEKARSTN